MHSLCNKNLYFGVDIYSNPCELGATCSRVYSITEHIHVYNDNFGRIRSEEQKRKFYHIYLYSGEKRILNCTVYNDYVRNKKGVEEVDMNDDDDVYDYDVYNDKQSVVVSVDVERKMALCVYSPIVFY